MATNHGHQDKGREKCSGATPTCCLRHWSQENWSWDSVFGPSSSSRRHEEAVADPAEADITEYLETEALGHDVGNVGRVTGELRISGWNLARTIFLSDINTLLP